LDRKKNRYNALFFTICLAERVRFELTVLAYTRVPGVHLKPLGHLSGDDNLEKTVSYYLNCRVKFGNQKVWIKSKKESVD
jgi:hypothetical protein